MIDFSFFNFHCSQLRCWHSSSEKSCLRVQTTSFHQEAIWSVENFKNVEQLCENMLVWEKNGTLTADSRRRPSPSTVIRNGSCNQNKHSTRKYHRELLISVFTIHACMHNPHTMKIEIGNYLHVGGEENEFPTIVSGGAIGCEIWRESAETIVTVVDRLQSWMFACNSKAQNSWFEACIRRLRHSPPSSNTIVESFFLK